MSHFIKVTLVIFTVTGLSSIAQANSKNRRCIRMMEEAKGVAHSIGYNYYVSTGDYNGAVKKGQSHLRRVCRNYCRGVKPRYGGKKITCREQISSDEELSAILSRVSFESHRAEDEAFNDVEI